MNEQLKQVALNAIRDLTQEIAEEQSRKGCLGRIARLSEGRLANRRVAARHGATEDEIEEMYRAGYR